mmetsp:Transcript_11071/g.12673  ORF Transcript_11071/g.12673 Transcript_11071/m.12673 type:complete len:361 (+) Transcript_11071:148-1230(+)
MSGQGAEPGTITDTKPQGSPQNGSSAGQVKVSTKDSSFEQYLAAEDVDLSKLRTCAWTGIPDKVRSPVWQVLIGYLPTKRSRRQQTLDRKRKEYFDCLPRYYDSSLAGRSEEDQKTLKQILLDVPRTNPGMPLFHNEEVRRSLERILYIWAVKHPASGYVQGMNELVTPFYVVFLAHHTSAGDLEEACAKDVSAESVELLNSIEADTYWCLTKLLDGIQDHYTFSQPGLQRMIFKLQGIVQRIDLSLFNHLQKHEVKFVQFAFRWMNCLLVREMKLRSIVRLWDTYLAEENGGFDSFHVYVCSALLVTWSHELQEKPFQDLMVFLQDIPTQDWGVEDIEEILGQAFILKSLFDQSPSHLG